MTVRHILGSLYILCVLLLAWNTSFSGDTKEQMPPRSEATSAKLEFSKADAEKLSRQRQQQISQLLRIAQQRKEQLKLSPTSPHILGIELLGEFRAEEAADFLAENITLFLPQWSTELIPGANYPCVRSLVKIGLPGINAILKRLDNEVTDKEMRLFATVVYLVDGQEIGLLRLEQVIKTAKGQKKKNLKELIELYKSNKWYI